MTNNNKSGFEIRADLLNQAQGIIEGNLQRKVDAIYSHNEIAVASEMNEFVNSK